MFLYNAIFFNHGLVNSSFGRQQMIAGTYLLASLLLVATAVHVCLVAALHDV